MHDDMTACGTNPVPDTLTITAGDRSATLDNAVEVDCDGTIRLSAPLSVWDWLVRDTPLPRDGTPPDAGEYHSATGECGHPREQP